MKDQKLLANTDCDATLAVSSGAKDNDSTYFRSHKNSPEIQNITPDFLEIIEEAENILEVYGKGLADITPLRVLFT